MFIYIYIYKFIYNRVQQNYFLSYKMIKYLIERHCFYFHDESFDNDLSIKNET